MFTQVLHIQPVVDSTSLILSFPSLCESLDFTKSQRKIHSKFKNPVCLASSLSSEAKAAPYQLQSNSEGGGSAKNWEIWVPRNFLSADKVFQWISGATSSPVAQYISSLTTFLLSVDPRIKLAWLLALVVLPARSHIFVRIALVAFLALLRFDEA